MTVLLIIALILSVASLFPRVGFPALTLSVILTQVALLFPYLTRLT